jgi:VWFA-related protein
MRLATVLLCLAGLLGAQPSPVIQTETRVVLVDAIVTGKNGAYIGDLNAGDFRVWEDNKEQVIKSVAFEGASAGAGSIGAQPRYLVLFLDNAAIEPGNQALLQQAVSSFIDADAGPNRKMAVVNYSGALQVDQQFTDNAGRLKDALKKASFSGFSQGVMSASTDLRARDMVASLGTLTRNMSTLPGRKIVVLLTGGLSPSSDQRQAVAASIEAANRSGVAIYPVDLRPLSVGRVANDTAGDPFDRPGRLRGGPQGQADSDTSPIAQDAASSTSQQALFALASGTGGFVIPNSSALLGRLQEIGQEQDQYYVLSYAPPESKEGSCHSLRVKVDRKGTSVRARSNYCTAKSLDLLAGTSSEKDLEARALGAQAGGIAASVELSYFYVAPDVARVNLAMEIAPEALKFQNQKGKLHAEVDLLGIASTPDGSVGARFSDAVKFDFENQAEIEKLKGKPLHYEKEFKIAPGQYNFTMALSSGGQTFGKLEMPLDVQSWKAGELALSALVLSKEAHPAGDLGLGPGVSIGDQTPLVAQGVQVIPTGSNQFMKSEQAFFYFEVYGSNPASVTAQVRILDHATGAPKWDTGVQKLSVPQQGGGLPINSLAPGSYQLEVTAADSSGYQVRRTTDFEVK